jgi:hypothetical protein
VWRASSSTQLSAWIVALSSTLMSRRARRSLDLEGGMVGRGVEILTVIQWGRWSDRNRDRSLLTVPTDRTREEVGRGERNV